MSTSKFLEKYTAFKRMSQKRNVNYTCFFLKEKRFENTDKTS